MSIKVTSHFVSDPLLICVIALGKWVVNGVTLNSEPITLPNNLGVIYPIDQLLTSHSEVHEAIVAAGPQSPIFSPAAVPQVRSASTTTTTTKPDPEDPCPSCKSFVEILEAALKNDKEKREFGEFLRYIKASNIENELSETDG